MSTTQQSIYIPRQHFRKLLFPPGTIVRILLPLLGIWYAQNLHSSMDYTKPRVMEVVLATPIDQKMFPHIFQNKPYLGRNYHDILISGYSTQDSISLELARRKIKHIIRTQNTVSGVHIHFGEQAKYEALVRALDICNIERVRSFIFFPNDLWIYYPPAKKHQRIAGPGKLRSHVIRKPLP